MEKNYNEERFDSFLNKTIILSSKYYFKKNMNIIHKENTIVDNEDFSEYLQDFAELNRSFDAIANVELSVELDYALNCLSDIEQAVIFLLFKMDLSQNEVANVLEVYSKTVSKIKIRAIKKMKKYMEGDNKNEK